MERNENRWIAYIMDIISVRDEVIIYDSQVFELRCKVLSNTTIAINKMIQMVKNGEPITIPEDVMLEEDIFLFILHILYKMFAVIPDELGKFSEKKKDLFEFNPNETVQNLMMFAGVRPEFAKKYCSKAL